ncbi:hypothetical protein F5887DRAFT_938711 [Amanita rubescens]|nr:hypothetical protein F5887DRAFT_938711 [Amanita rubescens]
MLASRRPWLGFNYPQRKPGTQEFTADHLPRRLSVKFPSQFTGQLLAFLSTRIEMLSERAINITSSLLDSTTTCDDVQHCRTLFSIIFSCGSTMFLCTWVALHPNVPKNPYSPWYIKIGQRVGFVLLALLAPEAILTWACSDWIISSFILVEVLDRHPGSDWTETHAQLLNMGGFNLISEDGTPSHEINDRSKGDLIAKTIAVVQTLWFIIQVFVRSSQGLTVTKLEFTTFAHTVLNIFIYLCWWNKPVGIIFPFDVYPIKKQGWNPGVERRAIEEEEVILGRGKRPRQLPLRVRLGKYIADVLRGGAGQPSWQIVRLGLCVCLVGSLFGAIHCFSWNAFFPVPIELKFWRISAVVVTVSPSFVILPALFIYVTTSGAGRLYLLILALLALPHLPYTAYLTPSWTIYLPHIA